MIPVPAKCQIQSSRCQVEDPSPQPKGSANFLDQPGVQCPTICPQGCESRLRSGQPLQLLKLHRQCLSKIMTRRRLPASSTRKLAGPSKGTSLRISRQRHLDKSTLPPERTSSAANEAPFCSAVMWAVFTLKPHTPQRSDTMRRTASQLHNSHASPTPCKLIHAFEHALTDNVPVSASCGFP